MASSLDNITNVTPKRPREEEQTLTEEQEETKRQKPSSSTSYNHILSSLLEEEEEDPNQDLTSLITTLQEELFSPSPAVGNDRDAPATEEVMRRLLEASDDELGIPNRGEEEEEEEGLVVVGGSGNSNNSGGGFEEEQVFELCCGVDDGFWEFDDVGFSNGFLPPEMFI